MLSKDPYLHQEALAVASALAFRNSSTACTGSTDPTPALSLALLESLAISCFLLRSTGKFTWKYGEVHLTICLSTREA